MPEEIFALIALIMTGTFTLIGLRMFLNYRVKRFAQPKGGDPRRLEESMTALREELYLLRNDVSDLQERVEFTERVLAKSRQDGPPALPRS